MVALKPTWKLTPNLWGILIAPPSTAKSAAINKAMRPLREAISHITSEWESTSYGVVAERASLAGDLKRITAELEETGDEATRTELRCKYASVSRSLEELPNDPPRYLVTDATPEALVDLLDRNPRGLTVVADELYGLFEQFDKQTHKGQRQFYLTAWNGEGIYHSDRIGRGAQTLKDPCLSIIGGIQPSRLGDVLKGINGGAAGDGLMQRFQLVIYPDRRQLQQFDADVWESAGATAAALDQARFTYATLLRQPFDPAAGPTEVAFEDTAREAAWAFLKMTQVETREMDSSSVSDAWLSVRSKLPVLFGRLVIVLHASSCASDGILPCDRPIADPTVEMAIRWVDYLLGHARRVYGGFTSPRSQALYALAERISSGAVRHLVRPREIARRNWSGLAGTADQTATELVKTAIDDLEELGWVRVVTERTGGRPADYVVLHPDLR